ncbi:uncharacterized protein B4U79_14577 [Dinothrombium tinctorium]|uniref:A-kinase anchor protein 2 C-terminal domain-containing protein n=1 Tax=Dinothrombium tinctorium TaxID=1965070 RepID=A0A3S3QMT9_9ACAR|nr:uncharacterized protein B4U79_14577 [Dinothrombium tinctorium]
MASCAYSSQVVDTTSIIEKKEVTKDYWEKRMMAEQELIEEDLLLKHDVDASESTPSKLNQCKMNNSNANEQINFGNSRKLGSDGESEASPESSLSPLEVDSFEEGGSDGRQSTEATDSELLLLGNFCEETPNNQCSKVESEVNNKIVGNEKGLECKLSNNDLNETNIESVFDDDDEKEELSTVPEEEHEPDSLEEFIKHENECMEDDNVVNGEGPESSSKENIYEEIGTPHISRDEDLMSSSCDQKCELQANNKDTEPFQNLIEFEVEVESENVELDAKSDKPENTYKQQDLMSISPLFVSNELSATENALETSFTNGEVMPVLDGGIQSRNEQDVDKQKGNTCKPYIIGQTYQLASDSVSVVRGQQETLKQDIVNEKITLKSTENKIAEEIREQKMREEELRKMREEIKLKQAKVSEMNSSKNLVIDAVTNGHVNGRTSPTVSELSCAGFSMVSFDSLDNFLMRSGDKVKVKPLTCENELDTPQYKVLNESPIEREIRITKEREEALRFEKSLLAKKLENKEQYTEKKQTVANSPKLPVLKSFSTGSSSASNIQKVLATTRIQQEIEEQTQREIELREKGSIKTISQERTDMKVTKLGEIEKITCKPNKNNSAANIENESDEAASLPSSLAQQNATNASNLYKRKSLPQILGFGAQKNISMHKFIKSKGKSANASFSPFNSSPDIDECNLWRPPQIFKGEKAIRRAVPAESKIQEELKEMKAREEELKWQRARLIGKSQPNLATIEKETDEEIKAESVAETKMINGNLLKRTTSIPNFVDENQRKVSEIWSHLRETLFQNASILMIIFHP